MYQNRGPLGWARGGVNQMHVLVRMIAILVDLLFGGIHAVALSALRWGGRYATPTIVDYFLVCSWNRARWQEIHVAKRGKSYDLFGIAQIVKLVEQSGQLPSRANPEE